MKEFLLEMAFAAAVVGLFLSWESNAPGPAGIPLPGSEDAPAAQTLSAEVFAPVEMQFQTVDFTLPQPADARQGYTG